MHRLRTLCLAHVRVVALVAGIALPQFASAAPQNPPKPKPPAAKHQKKQPPGDHQRAEAPRKPNQVAANQQKKQPPGRSETAKVASAESLTQAFVALAGANHDYNGRRARALRSIREGFHALHASIMRRGDARQKRAVNDMEREIRKAEAMMQRTPIIHKPQPASDAQLRQADEILSGVRPTMVEQRQNDVLRHVDYAMASIREALRIR